MGPGASPGPGLRKGKTPKPQPSLQCAGAQRCLGRTLGHRGLAGRGGRTEPLSSSQEHALMKGWGECKEPKVQGRVVGGARQAWSAAQAGTSAGALPSPGLGHSPAASGPSPCAALRWLNGEAGGGLEGRSWCPRKPQQRALDTGQELAPQPVASSLGGWTRSSAWLESPEAEGQGSPAASLLWSPVPRWPCQHRVLAQDECSVRTVAGATTARRGF